MSNIEMFSISGSIVFYICSIFVGWFFPRSRVTILLLIIGVLLQLLSAIVRWIGIGHPPIFGTYEATLTGSWFVALYILSTGKSVYGHFRLLVISALPIAVILLLYGLSFNTERIPLTISERSLWVDFHALFSWLAFAPFTLAFCLSGYYLFRYRVGSNDAERVGRDEVNDMDGKFPAPFIVDELAFSYINFGFINHTIMFALGCYYSSILYGTWWQWDPAESTSLIAWLSVALYIHMRLFYNWKERRAAWLFLTVFLTVIFSYWGLIYLPAGSTFHIFDIDLKAH